MYFNRHIIETLIRMPPEDRSFSDFNHSEIWQWTHQCVRIEQYTIDPEGRVGAIKDKEVCNCFAGRTRAVEHSDI